jgi:hypothetical protein
MTWRLRSVCLGLVLLASGTSSLFAHHSLSAEFDVRKTVQLTGTVTKIEWSNPHAWFYLNVHDAVTGESAVWALQLGSPNGLARLGWTRSSLKAGDVVSVVAELSKDGWHAARAKELRLPDGRKIFARPASADEPK